MSHALTLLVDIRAQVGEGQTPLAGGLFRANPGVKGAPAFAFTG